MISYKEVLDIHRILIDEFGGANGIRDKELLSSALARSLQTFDGNKRTGYVLMRLILLSNNFDIIATQEEKYTFVIDIASGKSKFDSIVSWLITHTVKKSG